MRNLSMTGTLIKLFYRLTATRGRLFALGLLSFGMVLLALRTRDNPFRAWRLFSVYALGAIVPIASLVIGSSTFGDLVDDRTLVHLWLRPVSRPLVVVSAWLSSVLMVLPFTVGVPAAALYVAQMSSNTIATSALSAFLGTLAYCAVFVALGLRVKRALAWGLAYILIWEGAVANAGAGLARLALRLSTRSISFRSFPGEDIRFPLATSTGIVVLLVVTIAALALGNRWLRRAEVS
jgi:ABC-2 type transport system permease protein